MLEKRLEKLRATRDLSRKSGDKSGNPRVCLVGYTNSGKSTLMNTIARADVLAEDKLFATLDPKTVRVFLGDGLQILLTDTVGFIDRLPHEFIRAFESTLDGVRTADLLLHVVDISNENYPAQIDVVNGVLKNIGASRIPVITVYNKTDVCPPPKTGTPVVAISAKNGVNIDLLKEKIAHIIKS
jgi:GTP-binding protein HflX